MRRAVFVAAIVFSFVVSGLALFAVGGLVAKYEWGGPLVRVHLVADEQLRAVKSVLQGDSSNESTRTTQLYRLKLTNTQTGSDRKPDRVAFTPFSSGYLIARRSGQLYFVERSLTPVLEPRLLATRVPTNKTQFIEENPDRPTTVQPLMQFGVKDILLRERAGRVELYATYSFWHSENRCFMLRVSRLETTSAALLTGDERQWTTLLDTEPCLELEPAEVDEYGDWTFLQAGGRMAFMGDAQLLVTIGDHWRDGLRGPDLPQDPKSHIGKIVLIDLDSRETRIYSRGHRNPQGLYVDREGRVFELEHGPRGGDELNQIVDGGNYGWPKVSYGLQYSDLQKWPAPHWGDHKGYDLPLFTWTPAIGPSNIIRIEGSAQFPMWENDLIAASLSGLSLHRIRIREGRAVVVERIQIGNRIRDLHQDDDGSLVLLMEPGDLITISPLRNEDIDAITDPVLRGELLWAQCSGCHAFASSAPAIWGPRLNGIVGRKVARRRGYEYSAALRRLDVKWTEENLDAYLRDPQSFAPGSHMLAAVKDPVDRAAIIAFLKTK